MRVKFKTQQEPGTHLHICRNGTNWTLQSAGGTIEQVVFNDRGLGLDKYRVIVQEDGRSAMVDVYKRQTQFYAYALKTILAKNCPKKERSSKLLYQTVKYIRRLT